MGWGALVGTGRVLGTAGFSPVDVAGLVAWYEVDSLVLGDNDPVGTWADSSGLGNSTTQTTASKKPTYLVNIQNGKPVVRFATDDVLATATGILSAVAAYTVFQVVKFGAGTAQTSVSTGNGDYIPYYDDAAGNDVYSQLDPAYGKHATTDLDTAFSLLVQRFDGAGAANADRMQLRRNGAAVALAFTGTIPAVTAASTALYLGGYNATPLTPLNGDIAAVLVYTAALSGAQIAAIESYLNTRWAVY